jgi:chromosomal replication initiator protein
MSENIEQSKMPDLWKRAETIYNSIIHDEEEKTKTARYFSMITSVIIENNNIFVLTSNAFAADFIEKNYREDIKKCLLLAGSDSNVTLTFKMDENAKISQQAPIIPTYKKEENIVKQEKEVKKEYNASSFIHSLPLNPNYTFDEFVIGTSNSWAHAAAKGVVENPGSGYNPLFIHGGTGLGKTHLMQAIGNEILKTNPSLSVCYITAETFLNEYISNLQNKGNLNEFREIYRKTDVLLIDDVQFLQRGEQCQEEFFNTFNALTDAKKQIVMTSDVAPKFLKKISERLISRFEGGMVQEIESPSYETRMAILRKKTEAMNVNIPDNAIIFIADKIKSHVRAIEGALAKVKISVLMNPSLVLTDEMLTRLLKDFIEKENTLKKLTIKEIQEVVAKKFSVTMEQILSAERTQSIVTPRQLAMYISRKYTTKSLQEIAENFDKTHATIVHGVGAIEKRLDVEDDLRITLNEIVSDFGLTASSI